MGWKLVLIIGYAGLPLLTTPLPALYDYLKGNNSQEIQS